ncbi:hypothetical protein BO1005MUT1_470155 [Hyphomicrobiales bacterium]|nr:hypothetical protein BO1005MUT1_470155 [Hyphomicrobiales bacterium]
MTGLSHRFSRQVKRVAQFFRMKRVLSASFRLPWHAGHCIDRFLLVRPEAERMAHASMEVAQTPMESSSRVSAFDEILSGLIQGSEGSAPGEAG